MPTRVPLSQLRSSGGQFASANGVVWRGLDVIANNINRRGTTLNKSRRDAMERLAQQMEAWARTNATWSDRTGDARRKLQGIAIHNEGAQTSTAYISHGVDYGFWLETMKSGEFAIIMPTILHFSGMVFATVVEVDSFDSILTAVYQGGDGDIGL